MVSFWVALLVLLAALVVFALLSKLYAAIVIRPGRIVSKKFPDGKDHYFVAGDEGIDVVFNQIYKQQIYFRYGVSLPQKPLVIDLGGNVGFFSEFVNSKYPGAQIHVVEPIPELAKCCRLNLEDGIKDGRVHVHEVAIGKENGKKLSLRFDTLLTSATTAHFDIQFRMSAFQNLTAIIVDGGRNGLFPKLLCAPLAATRTVPVVKYIVLFLSLLMLIPFMIQKAMKSRVRNVDCVTATLSSLLAKTESAGASNPIHLLKIDCEMAEWDALMGISDADWSRIQQISVEVHGSKRTQDIKDLLRRKGFKKFFVDDEDDYLLLQYMDVHTLYAMRE